METAVDVNKCFAQIKLPVLSYQQIKVHVIAFTRYLAGMRIRIRLDPLIFGPPDPVLFHWIRILPVKTDL